MSDTDIPIRPQVQAGRFQVNVDTLLRTQMARLLDRAERNINFECGYPDSPTIETFRQFYDREGVARRVVVCLPEETWALVPKIFETEDPDGTEFEEAWKDLADQRRIRPFHYLHRVDELSGIGRFGVLLLGLADGVDLNKPVDGIDDRGEKTGNVEHELIYLRVFDESAVTVAAKETDTRNPRFGQPTFYNIAFEDSAGDNKAGTNQSKVHWSRVIHVADGRKMSEVFGTPRMKPVLNRLFDIRKVLSGSGEMYWKGAFPGYSLTVDPELVEQGVTLDVDSVKDEMEKYFHGLQRYLGFTGINVSALAPQVTDPTGHIEAQLKAIAISMGIPFRILFGSEQGQLASGQDSRTWNKKLRRRQEEYVTPLIVRPFVDRLIAFGILPEPEEYTVEWPDIDAPTDMDKADLASKRTEALSKYVGGGVDQLIPPGEFLTIIVGMEPEEVDQIMDAAEDYADEMEKEEEAAAKKAQAEAAKNIPPDQTPTAAQPGQPGAPIPQGVPKPGSPAVPAPQANVGEDNRPFDGSPSDNRAYVRGKGGRFASGGGGGGGGGGSLEDDLTGMIRERSEAARAELLSKKGMMGRDDALMRLDDLTVRELKGAKKVAKKLEKNPDAKVEEIVRAEAKRGDVEISVVEGMARKYVKGTADPNLADFDNKLDGVFDYTLAGYVSMNRDLRKGKVTPDIERTVAGMKLLPTVKPGTVVRRGTVLSEKQATRYKEGVVVNSASFMSTSTSSRVTSEFMYREKGKKVQVNYSLTDKRGVGRILPDSFAPGVKERVYLPGTRIKVRNVVRKQTKGGLRIDVEGDIL